MHSAATFQATPSGTAPHRTAHLESVGAALSPTLVLLRRLADARECLCDLLDEVGLLHQLLRLLAEPG
eukprot:scaffold39552_cov40-Phaeocystis_antarctica.AAC.3